MRSFKNSLAPALALLAVSFAASAKEPPVSLHPSDCTNGALDEVKVIELYNNGNKAHLVYPKDPKQEFQFQTIIHQLTPDTLKAINEHVCGGGENVFKPRHVIPFDPKTNRPA